MFSRFFNRKKEDENAAQTGSPAVDFSFLGADMHSHFIPGIDDGAKTIDDSIALIKGMIAMGYKTVITTPHVMVDYYPNTTQTINNGLDKLTAAITENNLNISVRAAAEYYIDEYFTALLNSEPLLTVVENEVLVECSMLYEPPMLTDVLFQMMGCGYRPILAHPERYVFFHNKIARYRELRDRGCRMQLNMLSLTGYYGRNIKMAADELLAEGLYDYIGTDAHHEKHIESIKNMTSSKNFQAIVNYPFLNNRLSF